MDEYREYLKKRKAAAKEAKAADKEPPKVTIAKKAPKKNPAPKPQPEGISLDAAAAGDDEEL